MKNLSKFWELTASDKQNERLSLQQRVETVRQNVDKAENALCEARQKEARAGGELLSLQLCQDRTRRNLEILTKHEIDMVSVNLPRCRKTSKTNDGIGSTGNDSRCTLDLHTTTKNPPKLHRTAIHVLQRITERRRIRDF